MAGCHKKEQADLDPDQQSKLEAEIARELHIITAQPRLEKIARDFVNHYTELWTTWKAMFVCVNKVTCLRMYNLAKVYWQEKLLEVHQQLSTASQQEAQELNRKIAWMEETEMAVIISQEQNEIQTFGAWGLDIFPTGQGWKPGRSIRSLRTLITPSASCLSAPCG